MRSNDIDVEVACLRCGRLIPFTRAEFEREFEEGNHNPNRHTCQSCLGGPARAARQRALAGDDGNRRGKLMKRDAMQRDDAYDWRRELAKIGRR